MRKKGEERGRELMSFAWRADGRIKRYQDLRILRKIIKDLKIRYLGPIPT